MRGPDADGVDVLVRGAGPIGCTLALALRGSGLSVSLVDSSLAKAAFRPIALSYASRLILERVGTWQALDATPIETVQVSQQGGFGRTRMDAGDAGLPALGYVVDYSALTAALRAQLEISPMEKTKHQLQARCTVHAEGSAE